MTDLKDIVLIQKDKIQRQRNEIKRLRAGLKELANRDNYDNGTCPEPGVFYNHNWRHPALVAEEILEGGEK